MAPGLDVIVVAYNSQSALPGSLGTARLLSGVERIVVVNNGPDGSSAVATSMGAEVVELPGNPGFGAGQNVGAGRGHAPFMLLLNPDAEPVPKGVAAGLEWLEAHSEVAAVQGVITNRSTGRPERSQGRELGPVHLLGRALGLRALLRIDAVAFLGRRIPGLRDHVERVPPAPAEVETLAATALLIRRSAFREVDGFDERYFLYGEDLDLCRRLRDRGWRLVALPEPWALHTSGESSGNWFDRELRWWQGTRQFVRYWWGPTARAVGLVAAVAQCAKMALRCPRRAGEAWRMVVAGRV